MMSSPFCISIEVVIAVLGFLLSGGVGRKNVAGLVVGIAGDAALRVSDGLQPALARVGVFGRAAESIRFACQIAVHVIGVACGVSVRVRDGGEVVRLHIFG